MPDPDGSDDEDQDAEKALPDLPPDVDALPPAPAGPTVPARLHLPEPRVAYDKVREAWPEVLGSFPVVQPAAWDLVTVADVVKVTPVAVEVQGPDGLWMLEWVRSGVHLYVVQALLATTGLRFDVLGRFPFPGTAPLPPAWRL